MATLGIIEVSSSVFIFVSLVNQILRRDSSLCARRVKVLSLLTILWVLSDGLSYTLNHPGTPTWILYALYLCAYTLSSFVAIGFLSYCSAYIREKTLLQKWVFRVPMALAAINIITSVIWFARGRLVAPADGYLEIVGTVPTYALVLYAIALTYAPIVAFIKRKDCGQSAFIILSLYLVPIIPSMIYLAVTGIDLTVLAGALSTAAIITILQQDVSEGWKTEVATQRAIAENNERVLALQDNFESLYDVDLDTGDYELYVKGNTFREHISSHLISKHEFFSDTLKNIGVVVYPGDREGFKRVINREYIQKALSESDHFDWLYRLIVNGTPVWFRLRVVYKDASKHHIIIGTFNAQDEIAAKQAEEHLRDELINRMVNDDCLFLIDCLENTRKTIHDNTASMGLYTDNEPYSVSVERYIDNFVVPADREMMHEVTNLDYISKRLTLDKEYTVKYRDISDGVQKYYEMKVVKFSDTEILQSFAERDHEIVNDLMFSKLKDEYFALFCADIDSGLIRVIRNQYHVIGGYEGETTPYTPTLLSFADAFEDETAEFFREISSIDYVRNKFATEDKATRVYRSHLGGGSGRATVTGLVLTRHEDGTPSLLAIGFSRLDTDATRKEDIQDWIKENMLIVSGLAEEYQTLFFADMNTGALKVYSHDEALREDYGRFISDDKRATDILREYGCSDLIHPDDRHLFEHMDDDDIRSRLSNTKKFSVRYRRRFKNEYLWFEMDVIKYDEVSETANSIAVGFANRDEEIRSEQAVNSCFDILSRGVSPMEAIDKLLMTAGEYFGASRCHVYEYTKHQKTLSCTFEWCAEGVESDIQSLCEITSSILEAKQNVLTAPIMGGDEIIGYVEAESPDRNLSGISILEDVAVVVYNEILQKNRAQIALSESAKIFADAFLHSYESAYYVNLSDHSYLILSRSDSIKDRYDHIDNYLDSVNLYIDECIHPEDKVAMHKAVEPDYIRKHLSKDVSYSLNVRDISGSKTRWYRFDVTRGSDIDHAGLAFTDVTDQINRQEAMKQAELSVLREKRLNAFGNMINGGLWSMEIGELNEIMSVDWSDQFRSLLGFKDESDFPNVLSSWTDRLHPEDRDWVTRNLRNCLERSRDTLSYDVEYRLLTTSDEYRWYHSVGRMEYDDTKTVRTLFGVMIDINSEKKLNEQLALSDGLAREYHTVWLVEGYGEHKLHLFRSTGKKTVTRAVQRGLDEPEYDSTMVKYINDSVYEDDRERVLQASRWETVVKETPNVGTYVVSYRRYYNDEGDIDYHQMCFAKAVSEDGMVNYILAFRDADKTIREQMSQQKQLEDALSMAESANRAKTTFLNSMSHDIRTPMNAIIGFTDLALKNTHNFDLVDDYLKKIRQSSDHLLSLINDVLDMSRIEAGKMAINEEPQRLSEIIGSLHDMVQSDMDAKQHEFTVNMTDITDDEIICDKLRLNQILINIVSNSIKYTHHGGKISLDVIETKGDEEGTAMYRFVIHDNGIGMDEEYLKSIYEPFTRVKSSTISGIQGTGLGMSITKRIVDMMGGTIDIKSPPGVGTEASVCFNFKLLSPEQLHLVNDDPEGVDAVSDGDPLKRYDFTGRKVLVVEDNELNREIAINILAEFGFEVATAEDGDIAVDMMKAAKPGDYDIILMDVQMPTMDGYEATGLIRNLDNGVSDIPIIAMTAYAFDEDHRDSLNAGMNDHIAKPIDIEKLLSTLDRYLK